MQEGRQLQKRSKASVTPGQLLELGKLPPQACELEEAVLGAIMMDKDALANIVTFLKAPAFYKEAHQLIYWAICDLFQASQPVDILTVTQELKKKDSLERAGGAFYVTQLTNRVASAANVEMHARIVLEKYLQRELIRISTDTLQHAYQDSSDIFDLLNKAEQNLFEISQTNIRKDFEHIRPAPGNTMKEIESASTQKFNGVPSGFTELDRITGGWQKSDLILIGARPSTGKTGLAITLARNAAVDYKKPIAIFSLEMTTNQLVQRLISAEAEISSDKLRKGDLNQYDFQKINEHIGKLSSSPIFIDDTPALSVFELRAKARRLKSQHDISLIIVDYLQLMVSGQDNTFSREQEVSTISKALKVIAKEIDVPIIALSQLSRAVEIRGGNKRPQLSDLRESGCLHEDTQIQCPDLKKTFTIKELQGKKFNVFSSDYKNIVNTKGRKCFSTGLKETFEITLRNGQTIKATSNHKFLTQDGWKQLKNIKLEEGIAVPMNYGDCSDKYNPHEVSLLGHFISNGSAVKNQPIRYCCNILDADLSKQVMKDAKKATKNLIKPRFQDTKLPGRTFRTVYFPPTFHLTHGKTSPVADILRKYKLFDVRCKEKFIPDEFFYLSHKNTCTLLKSLFSGDGCACYRESKGRKTLALTYSSASERLIYGVQQLLAKVGIISKIALVTNEKNQKWYHLSMSGKRNIETFVKNIGFWNKRKNDIMLKGWNRMKNNLEGWGYYKYNEERTLCYVPVKAIKSIGKHKVYDIEVPKLHNFVANNIIVHNSLEQDADVVMFIYRPDKAGLTEDELGNAIVEGMTEIIIAKHRNGRTDSVNLQFVEQYAKFVEQGSLTGFNAAKQDLQSSSDPFPSNKDAAPNADFLSQGPKQNSPISFDSPDDYSGDI